ncbi:MAG TPA: rhodanese-like domain-containing protein [Cyclobacteriaceae bacterium]|jgi:rhodanese-related sulfurtransferase|nr:rhodanese-like domain-containing protein [Cyclobacteriaceae bacterium]
MKNLFVFLLFIACSAQKAETVLTPKDFSTKYKNTPNAILLDVRRESEVKEGALPNAKNIVYDDSFDKKLGGLSKETPIFIYCKGGVRSAKAAEILEEKGFKEVYQLKGGLDAWKEVKMPF